MALSCDGWGDECMWEAWSCLPLFRRLGRRCNVGSLLVFCVFFQAEDGIRDESVTGVQTCALPISRRSSDLRDESVTGVQTCALPIEEHTSELQSHSHLVCRLI